MNSVYRNLYPIRELPRGTKKTVQQWLDWFKANEEHYGRELVAEEITNNPFYFEKV